MTFGPYDDPPTDVADGGDVVLGLMPLAHALPTAWGRFLRDRLRHPYETWLEAVLGDPPADWPSVNAFWQRHHYDALVARWANAVGADRLVVTVGTAEAPAPCLTAAGAETVRRVNLAFHHREWPVERYREVVRGGVVPALERHAADSGDAVVVTPGWAVKRANSIAVADIARIMDSGVRVEGDLAALSRVRVTRGKAADASQLDLDAAVDAVMGAVDAVAATWPR